VDIQRKGQFTAQMKALIRQLMNMNKRLKKGKIKLADDVKWSLPRSLWRVDFPPPSAEIQTCNETCEKILKSVESKRPILLFILPVLLLVYVLYLVMD
jgi:predicted nucleic acid-binding Zn ribbon protein